jgi:tetrahydromethanopterin S-methyltransferase subunit H
MYSSYSSSHGEFQKLSHGEKVIEGDYAETADHCGIHCDILEAGLTDRPSGIRELK